MGCFGRESCNEKWCKENGEKKKKIDFNLKKILRCDTLQKTELGMKINVKRKLTIVLDYYRIMIL